MRLASWYTCCRACAWPCTSCRALADTATLLAHWAAILQLPVGADGALQVDGTAIHAEPGPAEVLGAVHLAVADVQATLARAVDVGHRVQGDGFHLAGVQFRLQAG